jgi:hypothetical protein
MSDLLKVHTLHKKIPRFYRPTPLSNMYPLELQEIIVETPGCLTLDNDIFDLSDYTMQHGETPRCLDFRNDMSDLTSVFTIQGVALISCILLIVIVGLYLMITKTINPCAVIGNSSALCPVYF